jgi:penicillin-binding protein 2
MPWKYRDHGLFVFFAPADKPRYAGAVVVEHGMSGSGAAAPVARDMMTFMFDQAKAMKTLETMEAGWGGDIATRMASKAASYQAARNPPPVPVAAATVPLTPSPVAPPANATEPRPPE